MYILQYYHEKFVERPKVTLRKWDVKSISSNNNNNSNISDH